MMPGNTSISTNNSFNESSLNFSAYLPFDFFNQCMNMDCIFSRTVTQALPVLRPLTTMLILIGLVGLVGNIFVILVYSRTTNKKTSTYLMLMLAITDLIACSLVIPGTLMREWFFKVKSDIICKLWELLRNYTIISSAMILGVIALDRFLLVYKNRCERDCKKIILVMITIIIATGISLGVPPMLGVGVFIQDYESEEVQLLNIKVCLPNDLLISEYSLDCYWKFMTALFGTIIVSIIVLYSLIFIMVYKQSDRLKEFHSSHQSSKTTSHLNRDHMKEKSSKPLIGSLKNRHKGNNPNDTTSIKGHFLTEFPKITHLSRKRKRLVQDVKVNVISDTSQDSTPNSFNNLNGENFKENCNRINIQQPSTSRAKSPTESNISRPQLQTRGNVERNSTGITYISTRPTKSVQSYNTACGNRTPQIRNTTLTAHVKTTQVLCIITVVYTIAFLPMFLIIHDIIRHREVLFYLYFINNAANPIIYSFMNRRFRQNVWKLISCKSNHVWPAW